jgi:type VI secretion system secreted protein Hcp
MAVFLKVPGIDGGVTEQDHETWIRLDSMQFGVGRRISTPFGAATGREAGAPTVSEIHISKPMDQSSIELFGWSLARYEAKRLKLDVVTTGRKDPFTTYELENAVIANYSVMGGPEGVPREMISLSFTRITEKFTPLRPDMVLGSPVTKGFDLATSREY